MLGERLNAGPPWRTVAQRVMLAWNLMLRPLHVSDVGPMLVHRLRRWPSIGPTSDPRPVFAGLTFIQGSRYNNSRHTIYDTFHAD